MEGTARPLADGEGAITAARERTRAVDRAVSTAVAGQSTEAGGLALVALGAYGRCELTPHAEAQLLVLHAPRTADGLSQAFATAAPRLQPIVRTVDECVAEAHRSFAAANSLLDARLIAGSPALFAQLFRRAVEPVRRDRVRLRQWLLTSVTRRHAAHAPATAAVAPHLLDGRGGVRDLEALRWLDPTAEARLRDALEMLLRTVSELEAITGHPAHRLTPRLHERVAAALGCQTDELLPQLYRQARRVAFFLDGALMPPRRDRALGTSLHLRAGRLVGERLPPLERAPSLGPRVANLVGFAPPDLELLDWAATPGQAVVWDAATLDQLWLLLRAADWRAWEFLDVTGLLRRYLPELTSIHCRPGGTAPDDLALDVHSFLALRRLHEWTDSDDPLGARVWRTIRHRDWLYLAVLLHELDVASVEALVRRLGLPTDARATIRLLVEHRGLLGEVATRRDLHDEDALLDVASRIGTRQRLGMLALLTVAHDLALGGQAWTAWKADLLRQLVALLDTLLRRARPEIGPRRSRSIDERRQRVSAELVRRHHPDLLPMVGRLPRRYLLARAPAFIARHLALAGGQPLADGEVRMRARRHRQAGVWDVLIVARDRPGLLATVAGVLALRGASVLAADAATSTDGLVLDVFTVTSAYGVPLERSLWPRVASDLGTALAGRLPLADLLATSSPGTEPDPSAIQVSVDNAASQFFSVVEVRAPDRVGLLYRIARTLHELGLDVHHAKIDTLPTGALDVFYVWDADGVKLDEAAAARVEHVLTARLSS
jgi:[protein-PII] uridylyltransferase